MHRTRENLYAAMGRIKKLKKLLRYKEVQESLLRDKGHAPRETDPNAEVLPEAQDGTAKPLKKNILRKGAAIQSEYCCLCLSIL